MSSAMKVQVTLLVLCSTFSFGLCRVSLQDLCSDESKRQDYSETVLDSLRETLKREEPFRMEDDIRKFFRLYNGKIYNLHQFVLRHPSQILCDKKEEQANMIMLLAFNTTKVHYTWNVAGINGMSGGFWTFANRITTEIKLSAPLNQNKAVSFTVDSVRLTELDGIWVKVDGVQPFAWIASQIGNLGTMISRGTLKTFLQNNLRIIFNQVFSTYEV
ncbi:uncharacterized protein LOC111270615 isoform X2 [Varroa jacobsoni]|uniref:Uncharacterized protein n=1 Tax=Varroa destructor TaxID=109461 RepID=A0A7M7KJY9_VARDE|nr:uncharacterized protein LOC111253154 [Varroa destructor]XP_022706657.1 uncharacterized protein LOC111270615 isoform X2 [Varroa jacobsoni]XP_022706658.1 uncharacterized protein LOC111270615 isoform X2 [Varroa jacobsoni]